MQEEKRTGLNALIMPLLFVCLMWLIFLTAYLPGVDYYELGIKPRTWMGILGIFTAPFVHSGLNHITSNTLPLLVVGTGLFYFYKSIAWRVFFMIYLFGGFWVWIAARPSYHVGASGLIYGLVCFMFFSGLIRKDRRLLAISLLVTFLYGSLVWGILPVDQSISWESHLFGSAAGIFAAIYFRKQGPQREKYSWELEEEEEQRVIEEPDLPDSEKGIIIRYDFKEKTSDGNAEKQT